MTEKLCRFGILGTAGIARKNWRGIHLSGNATVTAVASRDMASAEKFIDACSNHTPQRQRPVAYGSYEELLASDIIDAVYIPLPTAVRHEWVIRAAEAGKHVIGEKPAATNAEQTEKMLAACRKHKVQYMDGVMFMHSSRLPMVRELLDSQEYLGELNRMYCHFSFVGDADFFKHNIRVNSDLEPYGCLGDLGWYCIRAFLWTMKGQLPIEVRGRTLKELQGVDSPKSVPGAFSADMMFPGNVSASFYCSFTSQNQQILNLNGTKGYMRLNDFVLPYHGSEVTAFTGMDHFQIDNCDFHMENHLKRHSVREYDAGEQSAQEVRMIRHFAQLVNSGNTSDAWPEWTQKTQKVLDACFESSKNDGATVTIQ